MTRPISSLYRFHRRPFRVMLGRHLIISIPMVVGFMLIAGAPVIYALPVYAAFLIFAAPMFSVLRLATDRSEGTVEFLSTLPVRPTQLAYARVLALLEGCLAAGLFALLPAVARTLDATPHGLGVAALDPCAGGGSLDPSWHRRILVARAGV